MQYNNDQYRDGQILGIAVMGTVLVQSPESLNSAPEISVIPGAGVSHLSSMQNVSILYRQELEWRSREGTFEHDFHYKKVPASGLLKELDDTDRKDTVDCEEIPDRGNQDTHVRHFENEALEFSLHWDRERNQTSFAAGEPADIFGKVHVQIPRVIFRSSELCEKLISLWQEHEMHT